MHRRTTGRVLVGVAAALCALVALGAGALLFAAGGPAAPREAGTAPVATAPAAPTPVAAASPVATASLEVSASVVATPAAPAGPALTAYQGLGSWVDIYDTRAWNDPAAAVADMAAHGVRTLYIETGNSGAKTAIFKPEAQRAFIAEAHARGMFVVAWYLPTLVHPALDYDRVAQAIAFRTADGQQFDSFALDIESGAVKSGGARNKALGALSIKIRAAAGPAYPLGAIIPSPVGLSRKNGYWGHFPYRTLARIYDVFVPMSYYTYHGDGGPAAYADTLGNVRILRAQPGCATTPIHLIGGLSEESSPAEVAAFVRAARETGCIGAGLYGWTGTKTAHWRELRKLTP